MPYVPTGRDLETKSMNVDALHMLADGSNVTELDAHSTFSTLQTKATSEWFEENDMRTMIISRSAFAGQGAHASRWLGDNFSTKEMMGYSVTGIMLQNILGIPLAGSDICGFLDDTTAELCARWHTVGAFYPFSRNHNTLGATPQEPWTWNDQFYEGVVDYTSIMQNAIYTKYSLIPYYYTQLMAISMGLKDTLFKPVFFEFPDDANAYWDQEKNIMLGEALKLSIMSNELTDDETNNSADFYFPAGTWCDIMNTTQACFTGGLNMTLGTKAYEYGLHLRDSYIIPFQVAKNITPKTTADMANATVDLHINAYESSTGTYTAAGYMINDDGESMNYTERYNQASISFMATATQLTLVFD
jgi:alpha-glucosidase (family GH31 glycosyl hydrolase)